MQELYDILLHLEQYCSSFQKLKCCHRHLLVQRKQRGLQCTWHVFNRRAETGQPISTYWWNAENWADNARADGYTLFQHDD